MKNNTRITIFSLWLVAAVITQMAALPLPDVNDGGSLARKGRGRGRGGSGGGGGGGGGGAPYYLALTKCLMFLEGQRSGKLPPSQRVTWRKDSALNDGSTAGVDLTGGYYDAGDNVKFGFPMAFTTTMLAWSIVEFGREMGGQLRYAKEALRWGTDYLLKATATPNKIYVQVGDGYADHSCWERPEDMDTPRTVYAVDATKPGSEVAGETAAALAAASIVFRSSDPAYANMLLKRAKMVYDFGYKNQGSYSVSLGRAVCPFYCDFSGYLDELAWGAAWLDIASGSSEHFNYIFSNINQLINLGYEFSWDNKNIGIHVLLLRQLRKKQSSSQNPVWNQIHQEAANFACSLLPESPTKSVKYTPGGLFYRGDGGNMQMNAAFSFILLTFSRYLNDIRQTIKCGNLQVTPSRLVKVAQNQVDYMLGKNPRGMSYMVGYGRKFPQRIHHRGASLPSVRAHPQPMKCHDGDAYYQSPRPNPNVHVGAIVGGPDASDNFYDNRTMFQQSEPITYVNAPMVGVLGFFSAHA